MKKIVRGARRNKRTPFVPEKPAPPYWRGGLFAASKTGPRFRISACSYRHAAPFRTSAAASLLLPSLSAAAADTPAQQGPNILGPIPGYSPQIGTLVSELTWIQQAVTRPVKGLSVADLDWLFDKNANSIGALLLHLAATETYYQMNTFDNMKWDSWPAAVKQKWDPAMGLGDAGRATIKGHPLNFYLDILQETRAHSLAEFKKRDDTWLMTVDQTWPWGPTNNLCKWFHVCEHESHHAGQIDLLLKRVPGAEAKSAA